METTEKIKHRNDVPADMARAAAHWWAGVADGTAIHDNGDRGLAGVMSGLFADSMREPAGKEALQKFEDILTEKLMHCARYEYWHVECDYGPDRILAEAAKEAGINGNNFPWKTSMAINPNDGIIRVSAGYRAPWVQIWPEGGY